MIGPLKNSMQNNYIVIHVYVAQIFVMLDIFDMLSRFLKTMEILDTI